MFLVRLHDLQHTFGSKAAKMAHDDPFAVQEFMGHTVPTFPRGGRRP